MPRRYISFTWRGQPMRRRVPSKAETKARIAKMRATKLAKSKATRTEARHATLAAFPTDARPDPHRRKMNGSAAPREPDLEGAVIHLTRAENWITAARHMGVIRQLDPAHREAIAALGALLGLSAP